MKFEEMLKLPFDKLLELPSNAFWAVIGCRPRSMATLSRLRFHHHIMISSGYRCKKENGVYYYWKEK